MDPNARPKVARFLSQLEPIDKPWTEKRLAFNMNGHTYLITNNFPHWTVSDVCDWLKSVGIRPIEIEVNVQYGC